MIQPRPEPDRPSGRSQPFVSRSAREDHRQFNVLDRRPRADQIERLKDHPNGRRPEPGHLAPRELVKVPAADPLFARARPVETAEQVQQSRLPRPRLAQSTTRSPPAISLEIRPEQGLFRPYTLHTSTARIAAESPPSRSDPIAVAP